MIEMEKVLALEIYYRSYSADTETGEVIDTAILTGYAGQKGAREEIRRMEKEGKGVFSGNTFIPYHSIVKIEIVDW